MSLYTQFSDLRLFRETIKNDGKYNVNGADKQRAGNLLSGSFAVLY